MVTLEEIYPPFQLRIECSGVELRVMRDDDFPELVDLIRSGIQPPGLPMPFVRDWHRQPFAPGTPDGFPTSSLAWWWTQRATFAPAEWHLALVVRRDGVLVGVQDVVAKNFAHTRMITTGSWLGLAHQGQGTGTLVRQMVVGFAFDELGALLCESGYIVGNEASQAVSRKVGYRENGTRLLVQSTAEGTKAVDVQQVRVVPSTYIRPSAPVTVEGAAELRRFFDIAV